MSFRSIFCVPLDISIDSSNLFVFTQQVAAMIVNDSAIRKAYDRIGWYVNTDSN